MSCVWLDDKIPVVCEGVKFMSIHLVVIFNAVYFRVDRRRWDLESFTANVDN